MKAWDFSQQEILLCTCMYYTAEEFLNVSLFAHFYINIQVCVQCVPCVDFCRPVIIFASSLPCSIVWGSVGSLYIKHQILDKVHFVCCKYYLKKRYVVPKKKRLKNIQATPDFKNKFNIRLDLLYKSRNLRLALQVRNP